MKWSTIGGVGVGGERWMLSTRGTNCLLLIGIVALISTSVQSQEPAAAAETPCYYNPRVSSCDNNNLRYSVVLDQQNGDSFVINHNIERIPATKPTKKPRRTKKPRVGKDGEVVRMFPALWREKVGAWKEKMRLLIAKRRAKMRRERQRLMRTRP